MADQKMLKLSIFVLFYLLTCSTSMIMSSKPFPSSTKNTNITSLVQRLKLDSDSGSTNCWASLLELQSCSGEVIQFFYDGETYLGPDCCRAIRVIEHHCWPSMLSTLGYSSEEGDILTEFCESEEDQGIGN